MVVDWSCREVAYSFGAGKNGMDKACKCPSYLPGGCSLVDWNCREVGSSYRAGKTGDQSRGGIFLQGW